MKDRTNKIGERIKEYRQKLGYSLKDLEKLTGISSSSLQRYETVSAGRLSTAKLTLIAEALNTTPGVLMGWESPEFPLKKMTAIQGLLLYNEMIMVYNENLDIIVITDTHRNTQLKVKPKDMEKLVDRITSYFEFELNKIIGE